MRQKHSKSSNFWMFMMFGLITLLKSISHLVVDAHFFWSTVQKLPKEQSVKILNMCSNSSVSKNTTFGAGGVHPLICHLGFFGTGQNSFRDKDTYCKQNPYSDVNSFHSVRILVQIRLIWNAIVHSVCVITSIPLHGIPLIVYLNILQWFKSKVLLCSIMESNINMKRLLIMRYYTQSTKYWVFIVYWFESTKVKLTSNKLIFFQLFKLKLKVICFQMGITIWSNMKQSP